MLSLRHRTIRCQILGQIRNDIAGDLHRGGGPRIAGGKLRVDADGVIHEIGIKTGGSDLLLAEISGELMDQGANHLQVPQLLGPY